MKEEIGSKEVKMQPTQTKEANIQRLNYEELNQACAEMSQQLQQQNKYIQQLHKQIQEMNFILQNKRMDYLLRVVELSVNSHRDSDYPCFTCDFVEECIREIQDALTISQEKDKEETHKEN